MGGSAMPAASRASRTLSSGSSSKTLMAEAASSLDSAISALRASIEGKYPRDDGGGCKTRADQVPSPAAATPLPVSLLAAVLEEVDLRGSQPEVGGARPGVELGQSATCEKVFGLAITVLPFGHHISQTTVKKQILTRLVEPPSEARPAGKKRLMGHLGGGTAADRVAVEHEQPGIAEGVEDGSHLSRISKCVQLDESSPSSGGLSS